PGARRWERWGIWPDVTSGPRQQASKQASSEEAARKNAGGGRDGAVDRVERVEMHIPVLRDRVVALLAPALTAPGAVVVDLTLGLGGHSEALLTRFPELRLVG